MSDQPRFYLISETIRNWAIAAGAAFIFVWYGCDLNTARKISAEVDARVATITEPLRVDLEKLNSKLREVQIAKETFEVEIAKHETGRKLSPVIRVKPFVESSNSYKGVRAFTLETLVANDGEVPVRVRKISLNVLTGRVSKDAGDVIDRTQKLWDLEPYASPGLLSDVTGTPSEAQTKYQELHKDCPHGILISLDSSSKDIEWEKVDHLSPVRTLNADLLPKASLSQMFAFILTENLYHNFNWYEFQLVVELDGHPSQVFEFLLPTGRQSVPRRIYAEVAKMVPETSTNESADVRESWTTRGSLVPVATDNPP